MKKIILLFLFGLIINYGFSQGQAQFKKLTVNDWIIYQGDTLNIFATNGDTLFLTRGSSLDTLVMGVTHWTLEGDTIYNLSDGGIKVYSDDGTGTSQLRFQVMTDTANDEALIRVPNMQNSSGTTTLTYPYMLVYNGQSEGKVGYLPIDSAGGSSDSYWTKSGSVLSPQNMTDVVKIDSLRGTHPGIEINQVDSVLQDLSANTGTDYTVSTLYSAFKFTASKSSIYRAVGLIIKKSGTISNVSAYLQPKIYTDNAGQPGTLISFAWENIPYGYVTTSYSENTTQVGQSPPLTAGTSYWLVIIASALPSGGNVLLDCSNTGTNSYATSTNGSTWTVGSNYSANMKFYYQDHPGILINARHYPGIISNCWDEYGIFATSNGDAAARFTGNLEQGSVSETTYGQGALNISYYSDGTQSLTTKGIGSSGYSVENHGINGETQANSYSFAGVRGYGLNANGIYGSSGGKYGGQFQSTSNFATYQYTTNVQGVEWLFSNTSATNDLQRILFISRETTGTPAAGLGGSIDFSSENSSGSDITTARIGAFAQKVTAGSERGAIGFYTKSSGSPPALRAIIDSTGNFIDVNRIGIGDWKSPAYTLEVSGNGFFADDLTLDDNMGFVGAGTISTTGNGTMTLDVGTGKVDVSGDLDYDLSHGYMYYFERSDVINLTNNVYSKLTNATNNLFTVDEANGITIAGDSITITRAGDYTLWFNFSATGAGSGDVYRIKLYKNGSPILGTIKASALKADISNVWHIQDLIVGDDIAIYLTNTVDNDDITTVDCSIYIRKEHD